MQITINLPTQTLTRTVPDAWNDCTPQQAMTLLQLLQLDGPDLMAKRLSALAHLLQLTEAEQREWQLGLAMEHRQDWNLVFAEQIEGLLESIPWLLEKLLNEDPDAQPTYQLSPTLTKCPLPELVLQAAPSFHKYRSQRIKGATAVTLYPPADGLANITGEELAHLFTQYERYTADPTTANCDKLIAMLYRKSKLETPEQQEYNWYGDRRQPFSEHNLDARAQLIGAQLHPMAKNLLLFWFLSCRMSIINQWPVVFKSKAAEQSGPDFSYWGVFRAITGDPLRVDELARRPHQDFLTELAWLENERVKEEMRRAMASV